MPEIWKKNSHTLPKHLKMLTTILIILKEIARIPSHAHLFQKFVKSFTFFCLDLLIKIFLEEVEWKLFLQHKYCNLISEVLPSWLTQNNEKKKEWHRIYKILIEITLIWVWIFCKNITYFAKLSESLLYNMNIVI